MRDTEERELKNLKTESSSGPSLADRLKGMFSFSKAEAIKYGRLDQRETDDEDIES